MSLSGMAAAKQFGYVLFDAGLRLGGCELCGRCDPPTYAGPRPVSRRPFHPYGGTLRYRRFLVSVTSGEVRDNLRAGFAFNYSRGFGKARRFVSDISYALR